jgi:2-haloacid dehalogenase
MKKHDIDTIIFDLGGVLIDWNPRYLYRKILKSEEEISYFLENICTSEWNDKQDAGRSFDEAINELIQKHPAWAESITAWGSRWQETIQGPINETVEILSELKNSGRYRLYALTNWSAETFPWALDNFQFRNFTRSCLIVTISSRHVRSSSTITSRTSMGRLM